MAWSLKRVIQPLKIVNAGDSSNVYDKNRPEIAPGPEKSKLKSNLDKTNASKDHSLARAKPVTRYHGAPPNRFIILLYGKIFIGRLRSVFSWSFQVSIIILEFRATLPILDGSILNGLDP